MEALIIIFALAGYFGFRAHERQEEQRYEYYKQVWKNKNCSRGQHFVGQSLYEGTVYCDMCKKVPKRIFLKKGQVDSWKW